MAKTVEGYFPLPCVALTDAAASFAPFEFAVETVACYYHYTEGYMACEVVAAEIAAVVEIVDSSACQDVVGFVVVVVVVVVVAAFSAFVVVIATAVVVAAAVVVVMDLYCLNWPGVYYVVDSDLVVEFFVL